MGVRNSKGTAGSLRLELTEAIVKTDHDEVRYDDVVVRQSKRKSKALFRDPSTVSMKVYHQERSEVLKRMKATRSSENLLLLGRRQNETRCRSIGEKCWAGKHV